MDQQATEPVHLEQVRQDAARVIIRLGLGAYELRGPQNNILVPESRVAWATIIHELEKEGYRLVTAGEYAEATGTEEDAVDAGINKTGTLFALSYRDMSVMPLPRKEMMLPSIEV